MPDQDVIVKVPDTAAHRRFLRRKYKATHAIVLYGPGHHDYPNGEFVGAEAGLRCFHLIATKQKWTYLVETATQTARKCENSVWKKLLKRAWLLDDKGRRVDNAA